MKINGFNPSFKSTVISAAIAATAIVGVSLSATAQAATVLKVSVPEMVSSARWVIRARVLSITNVSVPPETKTARQGLFTDVEVEVLETYAGRDTPQRVTMRLMGGVGDNGIALTVPGMPKFRLHEEVVLFLEPLSGGLIPIGLQQGVWRVFRTPVTPPIVEQTTEDLLIMGRNEHGALVPDAASHAKPRSQMLLSDLAASIRASLPAE